MTEAPKRSVYVMGQQAGYVVEKEPGEEGFVIVTIRLDSGKRAKVPIPAAEADSQEPIYLSKMPEA
jgi:hypothetical protein